MANKIVVGDTLRRFKQILSPTGRNTHGALGAPATPATPGAPGAPGTTDHYDFATSHMAGAHGGDDDHPDNQVGYRGQSPRHQHQRSVGTSVNLVSSDNTPHRNDELPTSPGWLPTYQHNNHVIDRNERGRTDFSTSPDASDYEWRQGIHRVADGVESRAATTRSNDNVSRAGLMPPSTARLQLHKHTSIVACLYYNDTTYILDDSNQFYSLGEGYIQLISENVSSFGIYTDDEFGPWLMIVQNNKMLFRHILILTNNEFRNYGIHCTSVNTAVWPDLVFASNNKIYKHNPPQTDQLILDANMPVDYFQMDSQVLLARSQDGNFKVFVKQSNKFIPKYNMNKADVRATIMQDTSLVLLWRANNRGRVLVTKVDAATQHAEKVKNFNDNVMFYASNKMITINPEIRVSVQPANDSTGSQSDSESQYNAISTSRSTSPSPASQQSTEPAASATPTKPTKPATVQVSDQGLAGHARPAAPAVPAAKRKCVMPMPVPAKLSKQERIVSIDILNTQLLMLTTSTTSIFDLTESNTISSKPIRTNVAAKLGKLLPGLSNTALLMTDKLILWSKHKKQDLGTFKQVADLAVFEQNDQHDQHNQYCALVATNVSGEIWQVDFNLAGKVHSKQLFCKMQQQIVSVAKTASWVCVAQMMQIVVVSWTNRHTVHTLCKTDLPAKLCSFNDRLFAVSNRIQVWNNSNLPDNSKQQSCAVTQSGSVVACAANQNGLMVVHFQQNSFIVNYTNDDLVHSGVL